MITLLVLLVVGCAVVASGFYVLFRIPRQRVNALQAGDILIADVVELHALKFRNFSRLFSDADYRFVRTEPKLVRTAKCLRKERRQLALGWLAAVHSDVLAVRRLRRLLVAYGVSQGRGVEAAGSIRVLFIIAFLGILRGCVFLFGPFAFRRAALWGRREIEIYTRSCQVALWRLPRNRATEFSTEWRSRQILAA